MNFQYLLSQYESEQIPYDKSRRAMATNRMVSRLRNRVDSKIIGSGLGISNSKSVKTFYQ